MKKGTFRKKTVAEIAEMREKKRQMIQSTKLIIKAPQKPVLGSIRRSTGSMTKPIPIKMRLELAEDKFMQTCCLRSQECRGTIQWHHNLIYAGVRINEYGAILPLCEEHHRREASFKKELNKIMYNRMSDNDRAKYPKRNWYD